MIKSSVGSLHCVIEFSGITALCDKSSSVGSLHCVIEFSGITALCDRVQWDHCIV